MTKKIIIKQREEKSKQSKEEKLRQVTSEQEDIIKIYKNSKKNLENIKKIFNIVNERKASFRTSDYATLGEMTGQMAVDTTIGWSADMAQQTADQMADQMAGGIADMTLGMGTFDSALMDMNEIKYEPIEYEPPKFEELELPTKEEQINQILKNTKEFLEKSQEVLRIVNPTTTTPE
tara:strand:+ start:7094 stop:7624 length:531 start_codon:yes stop_codon:yes gene_type:complete